MTLYVNDACCSAYYFWNSIGGELINVADQVLEQSKCLCFSFNLKATTE